MQIVWFHFYLDPVCMQMSLGKKDDVISLVWYGCPERLQFLARILKSAQACEKIWSRRKTAHKWRKVTDFTIAAERWTSRGVQSMFGWSKYIKLVFTCSASLRTSMCVCVWERAIEIEREREEGVFDLRKGLCLACLFHILKGTWRREQCEDIGHRRWGHL